MAIDKKERKWEMIIMDKNLFNVINGVIMTQITNPNLGKFTLLMPSLSGRLCSIALVVLYLD